MSLTDDSPIIRETGDYDDLPMTASSTIYEGSAVGTDATSGNVRKLNAGDTFEGFCTEKAVNSGTAGSRRVRLLREGCVKLSISGLTATDVDKPVYASDENTFTLTKGTNSYVGRVYRYDSSGVGYVRFDARRAGFGKLVPLTDNSTGTASDTIASISDTATKNAIASVAEKVNSIIRQLG